MTRADIADHLGLTIETVSRNMARLCRDGTIAATRLGIAIRDRPRMEGFGSAGAGTEPEDGSGRLGAPSAARGAVLALVLQPRDVRVRQAEVVADLVDQHVADEPEELLARSRSTPAGWARGTARWCRARPGCRARSSASAACRGRGR
jgi:DNA-binding Lrp family transcriptional regulator